jgi:ketol-acid reductoisomerase (EC 1.1.1.86)
MKVFYDKDCDLSIIQGKKVAIIGYGSQGHAQACNLKDSGVDVTVGLRKGSATVAKAEAHGLKVADVATAVAAADLVMILTPDEFQGALYKNEIEPNIKKGATLAFSPRLLDSLQPGCSACRPRRDHDRAKGPGPHRSLRVRQRRRHP